MKKIILRILSCRNEIVDENESRTDQKDMKFDV